MNEINNNHETEEIQYERLDPKNDFLFKKLFSSAGNEDLLIDLINSILKPPKQQRICQVTVTNPIKERDFADDKLSVMDIVARVDDGRQVTIEIQVTNEYDMEKRALYYWSSIFTSQMHIGMSYEELKKTISINILDYRLWQQTKRHHTIFRLLEESEGFLLTDAAEIHFLELRKMYRKWKAEKFKGSTDPLYRWFLLLMATEDEKMALSYTSSPGTRPVPNRSSGMLLTRASIKSRVDLWVSSTSSTRIFPPLTGRSPVSASVSSRWPLPATPAIPRISPACTSIDTFFTASRP